MQALAQKPEQRFPTTDAMRIALERYANHAHLTVSTTALADYMKQLFGSRPLPWHTDVIDVPLPTGVDFDGSASGIARGPTNPFSTVDVTSSNAPLARARKKAESHAPPVAIVIDERPRRRWAAIGVGLALVAGAGVGAFVLVGRDSGAVPAAVPAPAAVPVPAAVAVPVAVPAAVPVPVPVPAPDPAKTAKKSPPTKPKPPVAKPKPSATPTTDPDWDRNKLFPK